MFVGARYKHVKIQNIRIVTQETDENHKKRNHGTEWKVLEDIRSLMKL